MRFNPHAFKRANGPDPVSAIAATSADTLPEPVVPSSVVSLSPTVAAFIAAYGRPGANQVTVPEGSLAVTLSLKFNDSAPQVDHFEYHAPTGCPAFLVLLVKKQAQTENLARKALTACPELHSLDWSWKSEKYGGGHGNYLQSSYFPTPPALKEHIIVRKTYCGSGAASGPDAVSWEIQFATAWRGSPLQLWPHKRYGAPVVESNFSNGRDNGRDAVTSQIKAAWRLNERLRGVEIHFTRRPDDATLAPLRADRAWRYTGKSKCWYARHTDATVAWAKAFCENLNGGPATTPPVPAAILPSLPEPEREPTPIPVHAPATACRAEASERRPVPPSPLSRPERKFIRFIPSLAGAEEGGRLRGRRFSAG